MSRAYAIMAGNRYAFVGHGGLLGWTADERLARRFDDPAAVQRFIDRHLSGDLRVVRVDW